MKSLYHISCDIFNYEDGNEYSTRINFSFYSSAYPTPLQIDVELQKQTCFFHRYKVTHISKEEIFRENYRNNFQELSKINQLISQQNQKIEDLVNEIDNLKFDIDGYKHEIENFFWPYLNKLFKFIVDNNLKVPSFDEE